MPEERRVNLFRNVRNQVLRIPREWEFDADEALLRLDDGVLTVRPVEREGLLPWLASLGPLDVRFPDVDDRDLPPLDELDVWRASLPARHRHPLVASYAVVRSALERNGTPIGPNDLWIAAHALADGRVEVTGNVREFQRVEGLGVEDWRTG